MSVPRLPQVWAMRAARKGARKGGRRRSIGCLPYCHSPIWETVFLPQLPYTACQQATGSGFNGAAGCSAA